MSRTPTSAQRPEPIETTVYPRRLFLYLGPVPDAESQETSGRESVAAGQRADEELLCFITLKVRPGVKIDVTQQVVDEQRFYEALSPFQAALRGLAEMIELRSKQRQKRPRIAKTS